jgi:hypothetical protein
MWEPVGPLPASVYWRRRWVAIASVVSVIVLLAWGITALATRGPGAPADAATARPASLAAVSAPQQASPSPTVPRRAAPRPGAAGPAAPARPTTATRNPEPETSTVPGTSERLVPDDTPRASAPVPSPAPVPPTGPVPCTNEMLAVAAEVDPPEHRVGERPLLRLVVTNTSDQPCVRDLDPVRQEIVVWSADGSVRLWSSNDCSTAKGVDLRTLVPGQPVTSSVRWAGRTSAPGCPEERSTVPAGDYRVMSRVDDVISPPTPFARRP